MQKKIALQLLPSEAANPIVIKQYLAQAAAVPEASITGYTLQKKSIDARSRQPLVNITATVFVNEPVVPVQQLQPAYKDVSHAAKKVIVVGAGPCGLFAALQLIELGIKPIVLERGKDVRSRRRDLAAMNKEGIVNPESNYCFGEGGAGTYSDGKLYTRSNKRGDINRILQLLVYYGAPEAITYESHPHIGTNKLPQIITQMREKIIAQGGELLFEKKLVDFTLEKDTIKKVVLSDGSEKTADAVILATGHSARDVFFLLQQKKLQIEAKPFALGVRIEHPQALIDSIQYHCQFNGLDKQAITRDINLPAASYSLVQQVNERGVFSFCMCPGGIIAPAATNVREIVVNGWSPSKRNNPFANSGMVVQIEIEEACRFLKKKDPATDAADPLLLLRFQQWVEQQAYTAGGGKLVAPAQRMGDLVMNKQTGQLPDCSYLPGIKPVALNEVLPGFVFNSLQEGFKAFGKKMKGYLTNDAVVVATESRTSSPVRIPRDAATLQHPQVKNLYPAGEGAGYAGGIVSAAMDGEKLARQIAAVWGIMV
ncbi:MAG: FAD-dependent monooxygenase [Flavihumibacter sp.]|nr:FAD-dependent monooxygenase [Flavihumibacter sp.]